jgi:hypothetical protein
VGAERRVNMCKYCAYTYVNGKIRPVETTSGMEGEEIKENGGRVNSSMIYLIYCKNYCKCHKVLPLSTKIKKLKTTFCLSFHWRKELILTVIKGHQKFHNQ